MNHLEQLNEELANLAAPLMEHLDSTESEIAVREAELVELREVRKRLRATIRGIDPKLLPTETKAKPNGKGNTQVGEEYLNRLIYWLTTRKDEINESVGVY